MAIAATAAAWAVLPAGAARADNTARSWAAAGSGTWSTAANWTPAGVPGNGDSVEIAAPASGTRTVTYDDAAPAVTLSSLLLDGANGNGTFPPPSAETLAVASGTLTVTTGEIGRGTRGTVAQSGGTVTFGTAGGTASYDALNLGYGDDYGLGVYQLSGGSLTVNGQELVGEDSAGLFNQSGGTHAVTGQVTVSGSPLPGAFTQAGGLTTAAAVELTATAYNTSIPAALTVAGTAQLNVSGGLVVDRSSTPTPNPPGTITIAGSASVTAASIAAQPGSLNWSGGSIRLTGSGAVAIDAAPAGGAGYLAQTVAIGPTQSLNVNGTGGELVGRYGAGHLVQTGGTNNAYSVTLGVYNGGSGAYDLSGGTLAASSMAVGSLGAGTLNQTGGTNNTSAVTVGGSPAGAYNLSGGTASFLTSLTVNATGRFTQTAGTLAVQGTVTVNGGTFVQTGGTFRGPSKFYALGPTTLGGSQQWVGGSALDVDDGGPLTVNADLGTVAAPTVSLDVSDARATLTTTQHLVGVSVDPLGTLVLTNPTAILVAQLVTLSPSGAGVDTGTLDLGGFLDDTRDPIATLSRAAAQGFAGGRWTGPGGIVSTAAAADTRHLTGVGVIPNTVGATVLYTTFDGQPVAASDVLARPTYYGDTNLDGVVNAADYARIDAGFVGHLTGWVNGDFNYDGVVDGSDYALMDNAFDHQAGGFASPTAAVAAAVPEPTAIAALVGLAAATTLRRRTSGLHGRPS